MKIAVLAGGLSPERDVSLVSGREVCKTLREQGHQALLLDLFLGVEQDDMDIDIDTVFDQETGYGGADILNEAPDLEAVRAKRADKSPSLIGPNVLRICGAADIAFLALHGSIGENGKLQATLDIHGLPYTGSGSFGSAIAMDKAVSKQLFIDNGLATPAMRVFEHGDIIDAASLPYPCMVKPCNGGSSIGTTKVEDAAQLEAAVELAFSYDDIILIEDFIRGREFAVGVLNDRALPPIEICPKGDFFDYEHKYQSGASLEICPARIDGATTQRMQAMALAAFHVLRLEVYARMDFLLTEEGGLYILEANTLPGLTPASLLPKEAAAAGIAYPQLCNSIIEYSLAKKERI